VSSLATIDAAKRIVTGQQDCPVTQLAMARMSVLVRLHDKQRAESTLNSDSSPSATNAAAACGNVSPV
jgi:hypothetical protein